MAERMTLSLLRARVRAGGYQDDVHTETVYRLLFARWLARQGILNEWDVPAEDSAESSVRAVEPIPDTEAHATPLA